MSKRVIVLGAGGRFGRAAAIEFKKAGWDVTAMTRSGSPITGLKAALNVGCDVMNRDELIRACMGYDLIVNAVNPPYEDWAAMLPTITANVIEAARESGATVCIPGNVYVYGNPIPSHLSETTPHSGNTKKGKLRIEMEAAYRDAASDGVRTLILRGGDFIEGKDTGNWFESYIAKSAVSGKLTYPGNPNIDHAWAYLPDMARALVELAEKRSEFAAFEEFGFEGFTLKAKDIANIAEETFNRPVRISGFPWIAVRIMALFSKSIREVLEMRYLWQQPHGINGKKLAEALPDFEPTPASVAISRALTELASAKQSTKHRSKEKTRTSGPVQPNPVP